MRLCCGGPQARIDADKEQLQSWADQVGNRGIPEGLQLRSGEAHTGYGNAGLVATTVMLLAAGRYLWVSSPTSETAGMIMVSLFT